MLLSLSGRTTSRGRSRTAGVMLLLMVAISRCRSLWCWIAIQSFLTYSGTNVTSLKMILRHMKCIAEVQTCILFSSLSLQQHVCRKPRSFCKVKRQHRQPSSRRKALRGEEKALLVQCFVKCHGFGSSPNLLASFCDRYVMSTCVEQQPFCARWVILKGLPWPCPCICSSRCRQGQAGVTDQIWGHWDVQSSKREFAVNNGTSSKSIKKHNLQYLHSALMQSCNPFQVRVA